VSEVSDVVYLLTSDEDVREGRWTVAANATPVKYNSDVVGFQLDKLVKGRLVGTRSMHTVHTQYSPLYGVVSAVSE